ncbi:response regulator transcription factor [Marinobacterium mangrovicola]|uniref:DNA-binding response OmpR family regulator n=1 Tax=Marinobacterium mangrovicola TaxID=1476959 RepID=A0A4R1H8N6_9GAMM|nr:response regulator transcription factor [Marinobacterium mangrovicola]TCK16455.1 DNA-binding response OmpR family regulator [Marinobacterium mangrovicola]
MHLLLIEDDELLADSIGASLRQQGHVVDHFARCSDAVHTLSLVNYDLVLLDLGLPDGDGSQVVKLMRQRQDATPVLMLTARDSLDDRVRGLDIGADDYLTKPFSLIELEARVRALLRRSQQRLHPVLTLGRLSLDVDSAMAFVGGDHLELPRRELNLLEGLLLNAGKIVQREALEQRLFGFEAVGANALDVYVSRLRKRLQDSGVEIRTVRGLGYRLEEAGS